MNLILGKQITEQLFFLELDVEEKMEQQLYFFMNLILGNKSLNNYLFLELDVEEKNGTTTIMFSINLILEKKEQPLCFSST